MNEEKNMSENLKNFIDITKAEFDNAADTMDIAALEKAAEMIIAARKAGNRIHITGIGKTAHVSTYIASLFSSTGTPTYYLHGTEAVHGSCGQLVEGDVVICLSNSGETTEMKSTATAIKNNGCKIISLTGNPESWLARFADLSLVAHVDHEGGVLNRAPRASVLTELFTLQCLSILLQDEVKITPQEYVRRHPGGALGKIRDNEK